MKIVAFIPFWENYETNEFRLQKLAGQFLLTYTLKKLKSISEIDHVFIYASSKNFLKYMDPDLDYEFIKRPSSLDDATVNIEFIIECFLKEVSADIVLMIHPTAPFLRRQTIKCALDSLVKDDYDSTFTAVKYKKLAWFRSNSLNYDLSNNIPKIDTLEPVYLEQGSLYAFKCSAFLEEKKRLFGNIKITEISELEGIEIRSKNEFNLVELMINSGLNCEDL